MEAPKILEKITSGERLDFSQAASLMKAIMEERISPLHTAAILASLRLRGEASEEIAGFASAMREKAVPFTIPTKEAVDNCGTGGDGKSTFNISTASALLGWACGVPIVKHGNRSISSKSGSADFLEALGIKIDLPPKEMQRAFLKTQFAFLFAPLYHPAMKAVQPIRKELGIRTAFNLLGPLTNPAPVNYRVIGVYDQKLLPLVAGAMEHLKVKRACTIWGEPGVDEASVSGVTYFVLLEEGRVKGEFTLHPEEVGFERLPLEAIKGADPSENARTFLKLLEERKVDTPLSRAIVLNTAFLLYVYGKTATIPEGIQLAEQTLSSGKALEKLRSLIAFHQNLGRNGQGGKYGRHS
ncbi:MAG: anthranilate phosphoribosyltransferase [Candidatus Atribacteria bacterium]|nr:anthranilate phosphoribosyltransferase [Candidatus Atribacteria bacterium]MCD6349883.1 anthranilate phosphoribosyltransferase [Candidatus Atribacteria bacterium]